MSRSDFEKLVRFQNAADYRIYFDNVPVFVYIDDDDECKFYWSHGSSQPENANDFGYGFTVEKVEEIDWSLKMNRYPKLSEHAYKDKTLHFHEVIDMIKEGVVDVWGYYMNSSLTNEEITDLRQKLFLHFSKFLNEPKDALCYWCGRSVPLTNKNTLKYHKCAGGNKCDGSGLKDDLTLTIFVVT